MIVEDPTKVDGFHLPKIDCAEGFREDYTESVGYELYGSLNC
jgi:hypothetical protein